MGPRSLNRGNGMMMKVFADDLPASMGPRDFDKVKLTHLDRE